jgi:hypothetical protein
MTCALPDLLVLAPADQVYTEIKRRAKDALLMLIEKEREGEQVITWITLVGSHSRALSYLQPMHHHADQCRGLTRRTVLPACGGEACMCRSCEMPSEFDTRLCALPQVDRALVKNVLDIYIRVGMDSMDAYEADFEADLLSTTATFYKRKVRPGA